MKECHWSISIATKQNKTNETFKFKNCLLITNPNIIALVKLFAKQPNTMTIHEFCMPQATKPSKCCQKISLIIYNTLWDPIALEKGYPQKKEKGGKLKLYI